MSDSQHSADDGVNEMTLAEWRRQWIGNASTWPTAPAPKSPEKVAQTAQKMTFEEWQRWAAREIANASRRFG